MRGGDPPLRPYFFHGTLRLVVGRLLVVLDLQPRFWCWWVLRWEKQTEVALGPLIVVWRRRF